MCIVQTEKIIVGFLQDPVTQDNVPQAEAIIIRLNI